MTTPEELRQQLMIRIDALLARSLLVRGRDRELLSALRGYVAGMTEADLNRLLTFLPTSTVSRRSSMSESTHDHDHGRDAGNCCCDALKALACAAASIHDQHCCCEAEGNEAGCACCQESLAHVLSAMDLHLNCLRGLCPAKK